MNCLTAYQTLPCLDRLLDSYPIEHVWDMMGRRLHLSGNVVNLTRQLEQIWQEIPQETIRVLYHSMSRRVAAIIQARVLVLILSLTLIKLDDTFGGGVYGAPGDGPFTSYLGRPGPQGIPGSPGVPGPRGERGFPGQKGDRGDLGPRGFKGDKELERQRYREAKALLRWHAYNELRRILFIGEKIFDVVEPFYTTRMTVHIQRLPKKPEEKNFLQGAPHPASGSHGEKGNKGEHGIPGARGIAGIPGHDGIKGVKGETGVPGIGTPGPRGPPGPPGPIGYYGVSKEFSPLQLENEDATVIVSKGDKGDRGEDGENGNLGEKGDKVCFLC
ncbi:transposable element Tcb1 transposase [Trichonephila clavipes]|nr:transposable element Tcb1 transposase [Trichonephila clavipes]